MVALSDGGFPYSGTKRLLSGQRRLRLQGSASGCIGFDSRFASESQNSDLTGGGALINGMDKLIADYTGTPVHLLEDPTHSVVRGAAAALRNPELLKNVNYQMRSIKELEIT